ncbi:hypothetical protein Ancab_023689 [Ancistrocladus abbreviatus]
MRGGNDDSQCGSDCLSGSFNPLVAILSKLIAFLVFGHLLLVIFYTCAKRFHSDQPRQPDRAPDLTSASGGGGDMCVVCRSTLEQEGITRRLPNCIHIFHDKCIGEWLDYGNSTCPICRAQVTPHHLNSANAELLDDVGFLLSLAGSLVDFVSRWMWAGSVVGR